MYRFHKQCCQEVTEESSDGLRYAKQRTCHRLLLHRTNLIERKEFTSRIPAVSPNIRRVMLVDSKLKVGTSQQDELAGVFALRARKKERVLKCGEQTHFVDAAHLIKTCLYQISVG